MTDRLLITAGDVQEYARDMYGPLSDADWPNPVIRAVQAKLHEYLGFDPFVHLEEQTVLEGAVRAYTTGGTTVRYLYASARPVVESETTNVAVHADGHRLTSTSTMPDSVSYFAGWRPAGASLAMLQALSGLEDLTVLPPEVPGDIAMALMDAAVFIAGRVASGAIGVTEVTKEVGQSRTITRAADLARLDAIFSTWASRYRIVL